MFHPLSKTNRVLVLLVAMMLVTLYFVPLWSIDLKAPQYPEGLGMKIWVNKITGQGEFDLQNINLLNHYVGMQPIIEKSIPELQFMPYLLAFMILGAFLTIFYHRLVMIYLGILNFFLVGAAGLYDFWRWEYNYGHYLNPEAPISIPGLSYQPPLIGCKQLLNITSCSWPHIGGVLLLLSIFILGFIVLNEKKINRPASP